MGRRRGKKLERDKGEDEMIEGSELGQPSSCANVEGVNDGVELPSLEGKVMGRRRGKKRKRDQEVGAGIEKADMEETISTAGHARGEDLEGEGSSSMRILRSRITGARSSLSSVVTGPSSNENAIEKEAGSDDKLMDEKQVFKEVQHRISLKCACGKAFLRSDRYAAHLDKNSCGHPKAHEFFVTCSCTLIFATRQELLEHVRKEQMKATQWSKYAKKILTLNEVEEEGDHVASTRCACQKVFTKLGLSSHISGKDCDHPEAMESYLTCSCKLRFETRSLLIRHVKTHQELLLRKTTTSALKDNTSNCALEDVMNQDNCMSTEAEHGKNWTCICNQYYNTDSTMRMHIRRNHFDTPDANTHYTTCKCGLTFSSRKALSVHVLQEQQIKNDPGVTKQKFKCQLCDDLFSCEQTLRNHVANKHSSRPKTAKYQCPVKTCLQKINTMTEFRSHVSDKHLKTCGKLIRCPCCSTTFRGVIRLFRHVSKKHPPFIYKSAREDIPCPICDSTIKKDNLMDHFKSKHENLKTRPNMCIRCGFQMADLYSLHRHVFNSHKDDVELHDWLYTCKEEKCQKQCNNAVGLHVHMKTVHPLKNLKCYRCTDLFSSKKELNRHYSFTHAPRRNTNTSSTRIRKRYTFKNVKVTCPGCHKKCSKIKFGTHLRTVHCQDVDLLDKFYKCPKKDCQKIFRRIQDLPHHTNLHKWQCPTKGCYVKLRSKNAQMKHLNEDKLNKVVYKCSKCTKMFRYRSTRVKHEQVCTETSNIIRFVLARNCERGFCKQQHAKGEDMSSHILESHISKGDGYQCRLCGRQYSTKASLFEHLRNFHENHLAMTRPNYQKMHVFEVLATYKTTRTSPINPNKYTCRICKRGFAYRNCLLWHLRNTHHEGVVLKKDEIEMMDPDQLDLTCSVCRRIFPCLFSLDRHEKQKHPHVKRDKGKEDAKLGSIFWCPCCQFNPSVVSFNADPFQWQMKPTDKSEVPILMTCTRCDFVARNLEKAFLHVKSKMKKDYDAYPAPEEGLVGPKTFHHCATCNKLFSTASAYLMHLELLHWEEYKKELIRLKPEYKGHPFLSYYYPD